MLSPRPPVGPPQSQSQHKGTAQPEPGLCQGDLQQLHPGPAGTLRHLGSTALTCPVPRSNASPALPGVGFFQPCPTSGAASRSSPRTEGLQGQGCVSPALISLPRVTSTKAQGQQLGTPIRFCHHLLWLTLLCGTENLRLAAQVFPLH